LPAVLSFKAFAERKSFGLDLDHVSALPLDFGLSFHLCTPVTIYINITIGTNGRKGLSFILAHSSLHLAPTGHSRAITLTFSSI
jgi:hypothetical protein